MTNYLLNRKVMIIHLIVEEIKKAQDKEVDFFQN